MNVLLSMLVDSATPHEFAISFIFLVMLRIVLIALSSAILALPICWMHVIPNYLLAYVAVFATEIGVDIYKMTFMMHKNT